jgi:3-oxoacyl-[acyl-carrier protein] reductase
MPNNLFRLEGKIALVVGAGQGMGESSAQLLAEAGCDVALVDVLADRAERVATSVRERGRRAATICADVTDVDQAARVVAEAERALGGVDVLVSIVGGVTVPKPLLEITPEEWDAEQTRNVRYFVFTAREFAASLVRRNKPGSIVGIGSVSGIHASPRHGPYGAAKAALMQTVQTMAVEWAPHGIRVNAIAPGTIITPRLPETNATREAVANSLVPMRRRGTTEEIGKAALFLASDLASYVTGHVLLVDGGWMSAFLFARMSDIGGARS